MRRLILSFFGAGYLKPAPGTWGSLAALPAAWCIYLYGGPVALLITTGLAYGVGVAATKQEESETNAHDPGWIVIDEVVGQWIALMPVAFGAWRAGLPVLDLWPGILTAFLAFRLFDIWKPGPIGKIDQRRDATGVMLDDVLAGIAAALVVILLAVLAHAGFAATIPNQS